MKTSRAREPDERFDIDEGASDTPPRRPSNLQRRSLGCGKPDAHRLATVSQNGGWWNATTQELIPILPEDHPDYRENQEIVAAAIHRWNAGNQKPAKNWRGCEQWRVDERK